MRVKKWMRGWRRRSWSSWEGEKEEDLERSWLASSPKPEKKVFDRFVSCYHSLTSSSIEVTNPNHKFGHDKLGHGQDHEVGHDHQLAHLRE